MYVVVGEPCRAFAYFSFRHVNKYIHLITSILNAEHTENISTNRIAFSGGLIFVFLAIIYSLFLHFGFILIFSFVRSSSWITNPCTRTPNKWIEHISCVNIAIKKQNSNGTVAENWNLWKNLNNFRQNKGEKNSREWHTYSIVRVHLMRWQIMTFKMKTKQQQRVAMCLCSRSNASWKKPEEQKKTGGSIVAPVHHHNQKSTSITGWCVDWRE